MCEGGREDAVTVFLMETKTERSHSLEVTSSDTSGCDRIFFFFVFPLLFKTMLQPPSLCLMQLLFKGRLLQFISFHLHHCLVSFYFPFLSFDSSFLLHHIGDPQWPEVLCFQVVL